MINLIEGQIDLNEKNISVTSDYNYLNILSNNHSVEKRKDPGGGEPYFYIETIDGNMRFGITVSMVEKKIEWLLLRWLDGPCTSKGWDEASEKDMREEYYALSDFIAKKMMRPADIKKIRQSKWKAKWGNVTVSCEPRSLDIAIFMTPN